MEFGIDVDGRGVRNAVIDSGKGAELRFGSHRLTIGSDGGNVLITVERVEAVSEAAGEKDEAGLFTLKGLLPGRRVSAWGVVAAVLALFLIWPIYTYATTSGVKERVVGVHGDDSWISGPLSDAHKSLETNCQACHTQKFVAVTDNACLTCHKADAHDHADPARIALAWVLGRNGVTSTLMGVSRTEQVADNVQSLGVVLSENTAEAVRDNLSLIDELDAERYHHPASLDDETTIIAQALLNVS